MRIQNCLTLARGLVVVFLFGFLTMSELQAAPLAEYLRYQADDRVTLNALLWSPAQPTKSAVILVPGFYGSFSGGGHDYTPMQNV